MDFNSGESSDPTTPAINTGTFDFNVDNSSSSLLTPTNVLPEEHRCESPGCQRSFSTKRGLGVHQRSAHRAWYDARQNITPVRGQWSDEERALLARTEARLTLENVRFINQALYDELYSNSAEADKRSIEAIKGQRRAKQYKEMLQGYIVELQSEAEAPASTPASNSDEYRSAIVEYLQSLPAPSTSEFQAKKLLGICHRLKISTIDQILSELTGYLRMILPSPEKKKKKRDNEDNSHREEPVASLSNKQKRRNEYAQTQRLWDQNPTKCLRHLLREVHSNQHQSADTIFPYWTGLMTKQGRSKPVAETSKDTVQQLWSPITSAEIKSSLPSASTSPGPDGITAESLRSIPIELLTRIFNIVMWAGRAPEKWLESSTTLIPKIPEPQSPTDFRPITVSSVLIRTLHKVYASRITKLIEIDNRQKAFRDFDGCSENIFILDMAIRHSRKHFRPLYLASLDIAKAFDSVTHSTIEQTLEVMGAPRPMINYIMNVYRNSTTKLVLNGMKSGTIKPTVGVKQGDPLSPPIFNLVIDRMLRRLPEEVGVDIEGYRLNGASFADDVFFMASTPNGLQLTINIATDFLSQCGLEINAAKSITAAIRRVPGEKKSVVHAETTFKCGSTNIRALTSDDQWKYLGVPFTPQGRIEGNPLERLQSDLNILTKAPLKPQQRLFGLRIMVLPGMYHLMSHGATSVSVLRKADRLVRNSARKWLRLPHDCPNAYFHANIKDGGLGLTALRWEIPLRRLQRLQAVVKQLGQGPMSFLKEEIGRACGRLNDHGKQLITAKKIREWWSKTLHKSVDGQALRPSNSVEGQHRWIGEGTKFLSGRDFVNLIKTRINALPTRSRTARGRDKEKRCRARCGQVETLNHILQICPRTHNIRVKRHDAVVEYIAKKLERNGYHVDQEPIFSTREGIRKPDIVATLGKTSFVIDAQVVSEQTDLKKAHDQKAQKYRQFEEIKDMIQRSSKSENIIITSATLNWRGLWSPASARELLKYGVIRKADLKVISTRVLVGGVAIYNVFQRSTAVFVRKGVG